MCEGIHYRKYCVRKPLTGCMIVSRYIEWNANNYRCTGVAYLKFLGENFHE